MKRFLIHWFFHWYITTLKPALYDNDNYYAVDNTSNSNTKQNYTCFYPSKEAFI